MRLDRLLGTLGKGTRSEAQRMIRRGEVSVNGQVCRDPGQIVGLLLQLFKRNLKISDAVRNNPVAIKLIRSVARINSKTAGCKNPHSVFRAEAKSRGTGPEHHTAKTAL